MRKIYLKVRGGRIKRLYTEELLSLKEIAAIFDVHPVTVSKWLRKLGVELRARGSLVKMAKVNRCAKKEWKAFKRKIIQRDGGLCVFCGNHGKDVHHKIPVELDPSKEFDEANVHLLCLDCHRSQHPELPNSLFRSRF